MTRIFISHSHSDEAISFKLVNFILAALKIEEEVILCTSNPDQGLSYSASFITDQLKNQLKNSEALIILITADSLNSAWIPFEAGSFWTTDKPVIPILGTGLTQNDLPGPLKSFLSIAIATPDFADKLNSAINQLADKLQIEQRFTSRRNHALREFSQHLKDWKSKYPESDASQQQQIEELTKQLEEFKTAFQQEKEQIEQSYQAQITDLQQSYQEQKQLAESLKSQILNLEQELNKEVTSSTYRIDPTTQTSSSAISRVTNEAILGFLDFQGDDIEQAVENEVVEFSSENGVDYTKLNNLLKQQKWQEADQETAKVMLQVADREGEGYLSTEDINKFPYVDLRIINELWLRYSDSKFGFSIQKEIYESLKGTRKYDRTIWNSFGDRVGWRKGVNWLNYDQLTFDIAAPKAHLPVVHLLGSPSRRAVMPSGEGEIFCSVSQRLVSFNL